MQAPSGTHSARRCHQMPFSYLGTSLRIVVARCQGAAPADAPASCRITPPSPSRERITSARPSPPPLAAEPALFSGNAPKHFSWALAQARVWVCVALASGVDKATRGGLLASRRPRGGRGEGDQPARGPAICGWPHRRAVRSGPVGLPAPPRAARMHPETLNPETLNPEPCILSPEAVDGLACSPDGTESPPSKDFTRGCRSELSVPLDDKVAPPPQGATRSAPSSPACRNTPASRAFVHAPPATGATSRAAD